MAQMFLLCILPQYTTKQAEASIWVHIFLDCSVSSPILARQILVAANIERTKSTRHEVGVQTSLQVRTIYV